MKSSIASIVSRFRSAAVWLAGACALAMSGTAFAQLVDISSTPLFGGRQAHPNVAVTLSVEFPTVGAAYKNIAYGPTSVYLGYFDAAKCYQYIGSAADGYFSVLGSASVDGRHECGGAAFSGNFMNWATMSAIDEFRYAMTGGNRIEENGASEGTVIERANLPDGSVPGNGNFYASTFFPRHTLAGSGGSATIDGSPSSAAVDVLPIAVAGSSTIYVTSCKTSVFFGTTVGGDCGSPAADLGNFKVRVLVCDKDEGPVRSDLCLKYAAGALVRYKPVGEAQRNAARMRFSAFGYLLDRTPPSSGCDDGLGWNRCRYGGVLRAPMKYVGPTKFDASLKPSPNAAAEVASDGSLILDPEGTAASAGGPYSGFINYINKFGASGKYKRYDTMGEMFYEAIRYYQNLGPTPAAADPAPGGTLSNDTKDSFPLTTTWTDPIQSRCSANYIVNLSDSNTWDDYYLPGYSGIPTATAGRIPRAIEGGLDVVDWTRRIGVLESTTSSLVTDDVRPGLSGLESRREPTITNTATYFPAGAAYWANTNDIRADLEGKQTIKTISFDVAEDSITVQDRAIYLMGKYGGFNNTIDRVVDGTQQNPFWATNPSDPTGPAIRSNSEWEDATGSGFPANYLLASSPQKLINGLRAAFARLSSQVGTLSGASLTSANLTFGSANAYIATLDSTKWSGSVLSHALSVDLVTGLLVVSPSPIWDSGALLTARCGTVVSGSTVCQDTDASVNKRNVVTVINSPGTRTAVPFTFAGIATDASYLTALNTNPATKLLDGLGQQRLNYLRGYRADEAPPLGFRSRDSAMGDIINSGPVFVGPPTSAIPDADYQPFFIANNARTPAVYVGANDGMMHAIRASDGVELFAYVPGFSSADLNDLTNPGYLHETFVDTVPKVQEAKLGSTWKTVLLGANGNGAQGVFALDVTDPTTFGPTRVLFEFGDSDDADFGSVLATPEFAKLWVSGPASAPVYRYFAVVTGYNNKRTDFNGRVAADTRISADTKNQGVLFLLALDHTLSTPWVLNTDYYKFTFPAADVTKSNGLGPVTLLPSKSGDRSTAAMYFGDLQGNFWRFNTTGGNPLTTWAPALGTSAAPLPIFVAQDGALNRQPITARPELASGPFGSTLIFFGTGEYLGLSDLNLPGVVQSEYALLDVNPSVLVTRSSDLVPRTATVSGATVTVSGSAFSYSGITAKKGWVLDFPSSVSVGERSITKPAVRTGLLTFTTVTLSSDLCSGGNGYIYQVNALTGLPLSTSAGGITGGYISTVGIPGPPRVVDLTLTGGEIRATGEVINKKTQTTLVSGTLGKIGGFGDQTPIKVPPVGRINWREITNWNDKTGH